MLGGADARHSTGLALLSSGSLVWLLLRLLARKPEADFFDTNLGSFAELRSIICLLQN